jgi:hypothetical protein
MGLHGFVRNLTLPIAKPPMTEHVTPITLQMRVLIRTTCAILTPFRKHLICGMPEPAATGSPYATSIEENPTNMTSHATHTINGIAMQVETMQKS